jgi:uncharacterized membrane protein
MRTTKCFGVRCERLSMVAGLAISAIASSASFGQASFTLLGDLAGGLGRSQGVGISSDGTTVVGVASSPLGDQAFRWKAGTMIGLGLPTDWFPEFEDVTSFSSGASACSQDGSVVVGYVVENENGNLRAFSWTQAGGLVNMIPTQFAASRDCSEDGATVVGEIYIDGGAPTGFYWTAGDGYLDTGAPQQIIFGCSGNATVLAGAKGSFPGLAMIWTNDGGVETLGDIPNGPTDSGANAISLDGNVVVGFGSDAEGFQDKFQGARWTRETGMQPLGRLTGTRLASAFATNADGSVVVGNAFNSGDARSQKGFYWSTRGGLRSLQDLLIEQGVSNFNGYSIISAQGVSADGLTVTGTAMNAAFDQKAYIARLVVSCPCPADFDGSGGTPDTTDITTFFDAWLVGTANADADCSGGTPDTADIAAFFAAWLAGGC